MLYRPVASVRYEHVHIGQHLGVWQEGCEPNILRSRHIDGRARRGRNHQNVLRSERRTHRLNEIVCVHGYRALRNEYNRTFFELNLFVQGGPGKAGVRREDGSDKVNLRREIGEGVFK